MENEVQIFKKFCNEDPQSIVQLPPSGSSRRNYIARCSKGIFVMTYNENVVENSCFIQYSNIFAELEINTPKILWISDDLQWYIQEFLGDKTLSQIIEEEGINNRTKNLIQQSLDKLYSLQQKTQGKIDYSNAFEYESYDEIPILHDLNYFKFLFVNILELQYHKSSLLKEFKSLTKNLENLEPRGFMIRDFQSRNILVNAQDQVFFIDYQSAMYGPVMYDVVSFLYQAKAGFPLDLQQEMLDYYINLHSEETTKKQLRDAILPIRLIRNLQVLGAYGFRGLVQRKEHFINSIFKGLKNLKNTADLWDQMHLYPELKDLIDRLNSPETENKINKLIQQ